MTTVYPCAKINLGLNIVSKRQDGYHNLETVFYPIPLCDKIEIEQADCTTPGQPCTLSMDGIKIEGDAADNLVVKAYMLLKQMFPTNLPDVNIRLTKNIPSQAGMGGGSSDCAYTITALNQMFNLGLQEHEMQRLAITLGADCAFFVNPMPSYATGIGEILTPINLDLSQYVFALVKPQVKISTKEAFANITPEAPSVCCKDIVCQPIETWKDLLVNDFEKSIIPNHPEIASIKEKFYELGAVYSAMSGSGSTLFGIFKQAPTNLELIFKDCFTAVITV